MKLNPLSVISNDVSNHSNRLLDPNDLCTAIHYNYIDLNYLLIILNFFSPFLLPSCLRQVVFLSSFSLPPLKKSIIRLPSFPPSFFFSFLTKFPWNFIKVNESTVWVQAFHSLIFSFLIMTMKLQDSFSRTHQDEDEGFKVKCIRRDHEMDSSVWYFVWLIFLLSISLTFFFFSYHPLSFIPPPL